MMRRLFSVRPSSGKLSGGGDVSLFSTSYEGLIWRHNFSTSFPAVGPLHHSTPLDGFLFHLARNFKIEERRSKLRNKLSGWLKRSAPSSVPGFIIFNQPNCPNVKVQHLLRRSFQSKTYLIFQCLKYEILCQLYRAIRTNKYTAGCIAGIVLHDVRQEWWVVNVFVKKRTVGRLTIVFVAMNVMNG